MVLNNDKRKEAGSAKVNLQTDIFYPDTETRSEGKQRV